MLVYECLVHIFVWILILCFLEPLTMSCSLNCYLSLESREYSHYDMIELKLGRKMIVYLLVDCYEVEKKKKKSDRKRKEKNRKTLKKKNKKTM